MELTFQYFQELKDKALLVCFNEFKAVEDFEKANQEYIRDHFSGNWHIWKLEERRKLTPHTSTCQKYLEYFNKGYISDCLILAKHIESISI